MNLVNARRRLFAWLFIWSLSAGSISPALAQPAPPAARLTTNDSERALQYYREGIAARQEGSLERARDALLTSWSLQQRYETAANLGDVELKLGRHRDAAEHLAYFLRNAPTSVPDAERWHGQKLLAQARAKVGTIRLGVTPPDAEIYVDGQSTGEVPADGLIFVEPGRRLLEARLRGYGSAVETREVAAGSTVDVALAVPAGKPEGPSPPKSQPMKKKGGPEGWVIATGTTVSALGIAMGTGFVIGSEIKRDERGPYKTDCGKVQAACDRYNPPEIARGHLLTASLVSFIAAGAIGAGTLTYALSTRPGKPKGAATAMVSAGPGGVAGTIAISW